MYLNFHGVSAGAGTCDKTRQGWFRPAGFSDHRDPAEYVCPPGYQSIGLRCMGPCGGYWCAPVGTLGDPGRGYAGDYRDELANGFSSGLGAGESNIEPRDPQESAFPVGVAAVAFALILTGFVVSFYVHQSPAGRWYVGRR